MSNSSVQLVALSKAGNTTQHLHSCTQVLLENAQGNWNDSDRGKCRGQSILSYHLASGWMEHWAGDDTAAIRLCWPQQSFRKPQSRSSSSPHTQSSIQQITHCRWFRSIAPLLPNIHLPLHLQKRCYCNFSNYCNISCSSGIQKWLLVWSLL